MKLKKDVNKVVLMDIVYGI